MSECTPACELKIVEVLKCRSTTRGRHTFSIYQWHDKPSLKRSPHFAARHLEELHRMGVTMLRVKLSCHRFGNWWKLVVLSQLFGPRLWCFLSSAQFCRSAVLLCPWPSQVFFSSIHDYLRCPWLIMGFVWVSGAKECEVLMQLSTWNLSWCPAF